MAQKYTYNVLVVDDSEDDRLLLRRTLRKYPHLAVVGEVTDGEEAINWLQGHPPFHDREKHRFPDLLLLDLKMPGKSGYQVLEWLTSQSFQNLKVIVLSGSFLPEDINRCYSLGATSYFKKSAVAEDHQAMVRDIDVLMQPQ